MNSHLQYCAWDSLFTIFLVASTKVISRGKNFHPLHFYLVCLESGKHQVLWEKKLYFFKKYPRRRDNFLSVKLSLYSVRPSNYGSKTNPHCLIRSLKKHKCMRHGSFSPGLRHKVRQWKESGNIERFQICFFSKIIGPFIFLFPLDEES